jgi:hypothetical protein
VEQLNNENEVYCRGSLDDYELGRLLGCGCNAAVYEARIRTTTTTTNSMTLSNSMVNIDDDSESDIDILSRQSSNRSLCDDDEERLNELTLKEGNMLNIF